MKQPEAKFIRPFAFRRPIVIRRPIRPQILVPPYSAAAPVPGGSSQYATYAARPVIIRRPLRPLRPIRPLGVRPFVRPVVAQPMYVGPTVPAMPAANPNLVFTAPQAHGKPQRLPDIELRQGSKDRQTQREQLQRNLEEIKKPLLKILNSGAKIALHKVLQQQEKRQQAKSQKSGSNTQVPDPKKTTATISPTTLKNKLRFEQLINGAEVVLKHYLDMRTRINGSRAIQAQKRADLTRFRSALENNHEDKDVLKKNSSTKVKPVKGQALSKDKTTPIPKLTGFSKNKPVVMRQSSNSTTAKTATTVSSTADAAAANRIIASALLPAAFGSATKKPLSDGRTTGIPNLLRPWSTSNLLNLLTNGALYSPTPPKKKPSDEIDWRTANVSLIDAKIVNDTKGRRVGYTPTTWYADESTETSQNDVVLAKLATIGSSTLGSSSSRADFDAGNSEMATTSSEEIPVSAETVSSSSTKLVPTADSSEEVTHQVFLVRGSTTGSGLLKRGTAKPLLHSSSDETARSEELPLWVLTTRKPTHSFGFGHSVVINNHRAPSQNGLKLRRTTTTSTTRRPSSEALSSSSSSPSAGSFEGIAHSQSEALRYPTTTSLPPTSNAFPLEVFDTDAYNTTIVHQNIITIAKPTRPYTVRTTQKYDPTSLTSPMPDRKSDHWQEVTIKPINWEDSEEVAMANRLSQSRPSSIRTKPPPKAASKVPAVISTPSPSFTSAKKLQKPLKTMLNTSDGETTISNWPENTTIKPWAAAAESQFGNRPISQVPALLSPFGSLIQMFPNSLFRVLQTLGGLIFALPTMLTAAFVAAMLFV